MTLPEHRHIVNGRTFSSAYDPIDYDPVETPDPVWTWAHRIIVAGLVVALSCVLVNWGML